MSFEFVDVRLRPIGEFLVPRDVLIELRGTPVFISREAAKRDYGVALRDDLSIDDEGTKSLRTQRAAE